MSGIRKDERMPRYQDEDKINLRREIRSTMALARDLGYPQKYIDRFTKAKSLTQLQNMLIDARRAS